MNWDKHKTGNRPKPLQTKLKYERGKWKQKRWPEEQSNIFLRKLTFEYGVLSVVADKNLLIKQSNHTYIIRLLWTDSIQLVSIYMEICLSLFCICKILLLLLIYMHETGLATIKWFSRFLNNITNNNNIGSKNKASNNDNTNEIAVVRLQNVYLYLFVIDRKSILIDFHSMVIGPQINGLLMSQENYDKSSTLWKLLCLRVVIAFFHLFHFLLIASLAT